jgi:hypothetical protein
MTQRKEYILLSQQLHPSFIDPKTSYSRISIKTERTITMTNQDKISSTQSLQDSFVSNPNAHHTKPIQPPRSKGSRSQTARLPKETPKPATLTAEALATLSPKDKNETAASKYTRAKEFLHRLPDPKDACNEGPYSYPDMSAANPPKQWYQDPTLMSRTLHTIREQLRKHNTPLLPSNMHLWHRYQIMLQEEEYAQFSNHKAWLSLQYSKLIKMWLCLWAWITLNMDSRSIDKWFG